MVLDKESAWQLAAAFSKHFLKVGRVASISGTSTFNDRDKVLYAAGLKLTELLELVMLLARRMGCFFSNHCNRC